MKLTLSVSFVAAITLLVATSPQEARADVIADAIAEEDGDLDWTAGSVLGLQRGYSIHKKGSTEETNSKTSSKDSLSQGSLLGLQRGVTLQKVSAPLEEDDEDASPAVAASAAKSSASAAVSNSKGKGSEPRPSIMRSAKKTTK
eukprot:TRINITY_DN10690_c0_g1_i1.p2 TRINITY_DN10690_c0_g1~~TRINITY_DN10690_c0_g1_i1.p2  ORF type:complete len:144 (-),score=37.44 TRINITY_DN10690_c0_g1_i1:431-862(-)